MKTIADRKGYSENENARFIFGEKRRSDLQSSDRPCTEGVAFILPRKAQSGAVGLGRPIETDIYRFELKKATPPDRVS